MKKLNLQDVELHLASYERILLINQREPLLHELFLAFLAPCSASAGASAGPSASTAAVLHQLAQLALQHGRLLIDFQLLLLQRLQLVAYVIAAIPLASSSSSAYSFNATSR